MTSNNTQVASSTAGKSKFFSNNKTSATPKPGSITKVRGATFTFPAQQLSNNEIPKQQAPTTAVLETSSTLLAVDESKLQAQISDINKQLEKEGAKHAKKVSGHKKNPSAPVLPHVSSSSTSSSSGKKSPSPEIPQPQPQHQQQPSVSPRSSFSSSRKVKSNQNLAAVAVNANGAQSFSIESLKPVASFSGDPMTVLSHPVSRNSRAQTLPMDDDLSSSGSKLEKIKKLLDSPELDMDALRKISWSGIPSQIRANAWKVLLGYLPADEDRRTTTVEKKRKEYVEFVNKYYLENGMKKTEYEIGLQRQIHIDVPRTNPDVLLYQDKKIQDALERILYIWSIRHPASGYVQGINDLVTPFLTVFLHDGLKTRGLLQQGCDVLSFDVAKIPEDLFSEVEADSFWCFSLFLDFIQDHYTFAQPGIQRMVQKLEEITQKIDSQLHQHIQTQGLQFIQFAFRWMNCLLMRELSLKLIIRMFDALIAEGDTFENLLVYVCASFLKTWSEKLKQLDFTELVMFIQHLPTHDWTYKEMEMLLSQAYMLKVLYDASK